MSMEVRSGDYLPYGLQASFDDFGRTKIARVLRPHMNQRRHPRPVPRWIRAVEEAVTDDPSARMQWADEADALRRAMASLSDRNHTIVRMRAYGATLQSISVAMDVTRERARQIIGRSIEVMRESAMREAVEA